MPAAGARSAGADALSWWDDADSDEEQAAPRSPRRPQQPRVSGGGRTAGRELPGRGRSVERRGQWDRRAGDSPRAPWKEPQQASKRGREDRQQQPQRRSAAQELAGSRRSGSLERAQHRWRAAEPRAAGESAGRSRGSQQRQQQPQQERQQQKPAKRQKEQKPPQEERPARPARARARGPPKREPPTQLQPWQAPEPPAAPLTDQQRKQLIKEVGEFLVRHGCVPRPLAVQTLSNYVHRRKKRRANKVGPPPPLALEQLDQVAATWNEEGEVPRSAAERSSTILSWHSPEQTL